MPGAVPDATGGLERGRCRAGEDLGGSQGKADLVSFSSGGLVGPRGPSQGGYLQWVYTPSGAIVIVQRGLSIL